MILSEQITDLVNRQLADWPLAKENYKALRDVLVRNVSFGDHEIRLQFNPNRIISSSAKVDPKSVSERPCFLCTHNRPAEQQGILYLNNYLILLNPYPVFSTHLTVPTTEHLPQRISANFMTMLLLARDMPDYTIIYNGPGCGASAPDHFHFQALCRNMLPIEREFKTHTPDKPIIFRQSEIYCIKDYQRGVLTIVSGNDSEAQRIFKLVFRIIEENMPFTDEPMMNILTWFENSRWIIHIFPRKQHRPAQYFATGEKQIMLSPASIDMGGVLIIPREADYEKISKDDISDIFKQVSADDFFMSVIMDMLKKEL